MFLLYGKKQLELSSFVFYIRNAWILKNIDDIIFSFKQTIPLNGLLLRLTQDEINANGQTKIKSAQKERKTCHLTVATAQINKKNMLQKRTVSKRPFCQRTRGAGSIECVLRNQKLKSPTIAAMANYYFFGLFSCQWL